MCRSASVTLHCTGGSGAFSTPGAARRRGKNSRGWVSGPRRRVCVAERNALRILVVDDDPAMVRLAAASLMAHGFTDLEHVATGRDALLAAARADVLLLDQNLPDLAGREVLLALRAWPDPPSVVMVTAHGSETFAAEALRAGADDYLVKDASLVAMLP